MARLVPVPYDYEIKPSDRGFIHQIPFHMFLVDGGSDEYVTLLDDLNELILIPIAVCRNGAKLSYVRVSDKDRLYHYHRHCLSIITQSEGKRLILVPPRFCSALKLVLNNKWSVNSKWLIRRRAGEEPYFSGSWCLQSTEQRYSMRKNGKKNSKIVKPFDYDKEIKVSMLGLSPMERFAHLTKMEEEK